MHFVIAVNLEFVLKLSLLGRLIYLMISISLNEIFYGKIITV